MKKLFLACVMALLTITVYARPWTIDGSVDLWYNEWQAADLSDDTLNFSLIVKAGRYITDNINIGIRSGFELANVGNSFSVGPYFRFNFFEIRNVYFSATATVHYTRYNRSFRWNNFFPENDAHRITASIAPSVAFRINNNVELYWRFASITYRTDWVNLANTDFTARQSGFWILGPFTNNNFGFIIRI